MPTTQFSSAIAAIPASEEKLKRIKFFEEHGIPRQAYSIICNAEEKLGVRADCSVELLEAIVNLTPEEISTSNIVKAYNSLLAYIYS